MSNVVINELDHKQQLQKYIKYMNQKVTISNIVLEKDFDFLSNGDESKYEALDFFEHNWERNKAKLGRLNLFLNSPNCFDRTDLATTFIVVSIGSSSTQTYHIKEKMITSYYHFGTGNHNKNEIKRLTEDISKTSLHIIFIDSISRCILGNKEFFDVSKLTLADCKKSIIDNSVGRLLVTIVVNISSSQKIIVTNHNSSEESFKNKWTYALAVENKIDNHSFYIDYGGSRFNINHVINGTTDRSIIRFKYDQNLFLDYYKSGKSDIYELLISLDMLINGYISNYIITQKLNGNKFKVIIRQTGKLREYYCTK